MNHVRPHLFAPLVTGLLLAGAASAAGAVPAFPGAEGFGQHSRGGRGGAIFHVTTLADGGPGSLRACIDSKGPRVCIFRVGGVIRFTQRPPVIRHPFITIAGQTAPGGGILLTHSGGANGFTPLVIKGTHDVIVRHIRVRLDRRGGERGSNDGITIQNSRNVIIDHVSASWALDENINGDSHNDNITISWSIFAEGIRRHDKCALLASHPKGPQHFSFTKNLCAHNGDRNPDINFTPGSCIEIVNNVLYNAASQFAEVWESYGGTPVNIVGNYFRAGPDTVRGAVGIDRQMIGSTGRARIYQAGNDFDGDFGQNSPMVAAVLTSSPVCPLTAPPLSAAAAYKQVLDTAGAFPRDGVDRRVVAEVRARTGSIKAVADKLPPIASGKPYGDADKDGMSDQWERARGLDPAVNDAWADKEGDGWSNLDEFLDFAHRAALAGRAVR
jgi:pectate lyase